MARIGKDAERTIVDHPPREPRRWRAFGRAARGWAAVLGLVVASLVAASASAQQTVVNPRHEYNVKAAYLYSFGRYVRWPADVFVGVDGPFVVGVLGDDPFGGALDRIAETKRMRQRPIIIRRFKSLAEYTPSHILFVSKSVLPEEQTEVIRKLGDRPVLLVGDSPEFARQGGTLSFFLDQETIRFEINLATVRRQRLAIDAKLLKLAAVVQDPANGAVPSKPGAALSPRVNR